MISLCPASLGFYFVKCYLTYLTFKLLLDEMLVEKEKYKEIGDGLDNAFEELYGI